MRDSVRPVDSVAVHPCPAKVIALEPLRMRVRREKRREKVKSSGWWAVACSVPEPRALLRFAICERLPVCLLPALMVSSVLIERCVSRGRPPGELIVYSPVPTAERHSCATPSPHSMKAACDGG